MFVAQQGQARPPRKLTTGEMLRVARNIVMLAAAANVTYYAWVTFGASTAIAQGMDATGAYVASLLAQILCVCWLPVCGMLSDRVGRRPMVIAWGLGVIVLTRNTRQLALTDAGERFYLPCTHRTMPALPRCLFIPEILRQPRAL